MRLRWIARLVCLILCLSTLILTCPQASSSLGTMTARQAIRSVFGPRAPLATCIAYHESGLRTSVVSATGDYGLFQINYQAHHTWVDFTPSKIFNPLYNSRIAYRLSKKGTNWHAWAYRTRASCGV